MKKIIRYFFILLFGTLWFLGCSKDSAKYLFDKGYLLDDYRYGDLYRLANLPDFRVLVDKCKSVFEDKKTETILYLAGDSFTEEGRIYPENFAVKHYVRGFAAESNTPLELRKGKKILIIETVERHFRERFDTPWRNWDIKKGVTESEKKWNEKLLELEVPYNTQRHESVLFGSDFMLKIKEFKALLNLKIFGKTDDKVVLSKNQQHLFLLFRHKPWH